MIIIERIKCSNDPYKYKMLGNDYCSVLNAVTIHTNIK